jgi:hypothetical protein
MASAPVALGMAGTMMPDIPATMFSVWGIERYLTWAKTRRLCTALAAGTLLALAVLTRINLIVLLVIAGLWGIRRSWRLALPVALALGLSLAGFILTGDPDPTGGTPLSAAQGLLRVDRSSFHALALVSAYLLTTPLLAALLIRRRLVEHAPLLWCWLLIPFPAIAYFSFAPKYVLPALPSVAILAASGLETLPQRRAVLAVVAAASTTLGVLILQADARMSGQARTAAAELVRPRVQAGERVWFSGHAGFHWYAQEAGARAVAIEAPYPTPGEILVASTGDEPGMLCFLPRVLIEEYGDTRPGGRIISRRVSAGFYSDIFGLWPWGWAPPDTTPFWVFRVAGSPRALIDRQILPRWCAR